MRINHRIAVSVLAVGAILYFGLAQGQNNDKPDLGDIFKAALKDFVEEKASAAGIPVAELVGPEKVQFTFAGAAVAEPEVFAPIAAPTSAGSGNSGTTAAEQACYDAVQNKVPWDARGVNKSWNSSNVANLCRGTTSASQPGACFRIAMYDGPSWSKTASLVMSWSKASQLCAGTNNSSQTISCLRGQLSGGKSLNNAISQCDRDVSSTTVPTRLVYAQAYKMVETTQPGRGKAAVVRDHRTSKPQTTANTVAMTAQLMTQDSAKLAAVSANAEAQCFDYIQGNIAWDVKGTNRRWSGDNVKRLCKGTTAKNSPGNCFKYAMFSGSLWGQTSKHPMDWSKATDLCEGTSNANATTSCFKNAIAAGRSLDAAIGQCDK